MPGVKRTIASAKAVPTKLQLVRAAAAKDPDKFAQTNLSVRDKRGKILPFRHNYTQQRIAQACQEMEAMGIPVRLFVLKSRQVGSSTGILYRGFAKTWAIDDYEGVMVANLDNTAKQLLNRIKFCYTAMDDSLKLALSEDTRHSMAYADTRGQLFIVSAKNIDAARGNSKQWIQLSEWSYYKRAMDILKEFSMICSPDLGNEMFIDTTGKGYGSEAHEYWNLCEKNSTDNFGRIDLDRLKTFQGFYPLFVEWQKDPECTVQFASARERDYLISQALEYEPRLGDRMKEFSLSPGNIIYSYKVLASQARGDWDWYLQEHPCTADEAWRLRGRSYFGSDVLNILKKDLSQFDDKAFYYTFGDKQTADDLFNRWEDLKAIHKGEVVKNPEMPHFICWKKREPGQEYVVSGDSGQGLEDGSFSSTFVINKHTLEMCAEFHGRIRPDQHAKVIESLGVMYNYGIAAPEYNQPGNVTINELRQTYSNIYQERIEDEYVDKMRRKLGWCTNSRTRPQLLSHARRLLQECAEKKIQPFIIKSEGLMSELSTFQTDEETGVASAITGCFDDRVLSWGIAVIVAKIETMGQDYDVKMNENGERLAQPTDLADYDPMDVVSRLNTSRNTQIWGGKDSKIWQQWRELNGW